MRYTGRQLQADPSHSLVAALLTTTAATGRSMARGICGRSAAQTRRSVSSDRNPDECDERCLK